MKKQIIGLLVAVALVVTLTACGSKETKTSGGKDDKTTTLKIGASPTPHAEILEHVKPILAKEGIDLEIKTFTDYILPNKFLAEKELDGNYFQHIPYFNLQLEDNGYDFVNAGGIHVEPMALYSQRIKDIKDLKKGAKVITSNSKSDWGRIITILQEADLVKIKEGVDIEAATFDDIVENPKELVFQYDIDPALLASTFQNDEADLVAINANFAVGIGLNPLEDNVLLEADNSPYVNIIAIRKKDKDNKDLKKLVEVLHSKEVQDWIIEEYKGYVKPVNE